MVAGNSQPEWDCDVDPTNLSRERAEELRAIHASCSMWKGTVRVVSVLTLISSANELDIARARRAAFQRGLQR
jgi:hypothetical protein